MNLFSPPPRVIVLRPYQADAVDRLRDGIRQGCRRQILVAPTGAGKTLVAMNVIAEAQKKGATAWFIVDRVTLIDQTSAAFSDYGIDHGIIQADNIFTDMSKPVQVASAQTLARRKTYWLPDLIVVDEAHCRYQSTIDVIARAEKAKVIGLTATPFTYGMAEDWDGLVNITTVNKLLADGFLAPLKIKACVSPDMKGVRKKFTGEYDDEESGERGITIVGDVVKTWVEQTHKHFGGPAKTIVFSPSVKHGAEICRQFADAGYNFQQISYLDTDDGSRRAKIAEFRKPDSCIDGLVSCAVLTKGFDVADVRIGISCRPYRKSFSSHIQEMGRVMRIAPGKDHGLWLDHSGNSIAFADDTAWLFEYGVESLSDAQKKDREAREPDEKIRKQRFCGDCGMQMAPAAETCPSCGWERPQRGEIQVTEGELIDFDITTQGAFKPRPGLRADCLKDPRAMWNAALAYCLSNGRRGDEQSRRWAYGVWAGIYPGSNLPRGLFETACHYDSVQPDQFSLVEREVKRFRKQNNNKSRKVA